MGKTADLTAVQRTIIDTLHQEGKTQKTFLKEQAVHRVQFQSTSTNVCWKVKCGRKRCTTKRDDRSLKNIVKKSRFQNLGELQRLKLESRYQKPLFTDVSGKWAPIAVFPWSSHL